MAAALLLAVTVFPRWRRRAAIDALGRAAGLAPASAGIAWDQYFLVDENSAWANEGRRIRAELDVTAPLP